MSLSHLIIVNLIIFMIKWILIDSIKFTKNVMESGYWWLVVLVGTSINLADSIEFNTNFIWIMNFIRRFSFFIILYLEKKKVSYFIIIYFYTFQFRFFFAENQQNFQELYLVINFRLYLMDAAYFDLLANFLNIIFNFQSLPTCFIITVAL